MCTLSPDSAVARGKNWGGGGTESRAARGFFYILSSFLGNWIFFFFFWSFFFFFLIVRLCYHLYDTITNYMRYPDNIHTKYINKSLWNGKQYHFFVEVNKTNRFHRVRIFALADKYRVLWWCVYLENIPFLSIITSRLEVQLVVSCLI